MVAMEMGKITTRNMFSVEIDFDDTTITCVDDEGQEEDVTVLLFDDVVYIRQYLDEDTDRASIISMTPKMYAELMEAYQRTSGTYLTKITRGHKSV
jgi:hypothetical protein